MTPSEEAVEAAARVMKPRQFEPDYTPLGMWSDLEQMHEIAELDRDMTRDRVRDILTAALPAIEKEIRAQIAADLWCELPVQLAETAGSDTGWLSDAQDWEPKADELHERIDLVSDGGDVVGSIDLFHIAEHAAQIAKGAE